ncbi:hypothetical protein HKX48_003866 [Thoreauomyces humboldtii]|nr:hypothetical protein HKX48_003866 [Thoreauomyces humboldtii]
MDDSSLKSLNIFGKGAPGDIAAPIVFSPPFSRTIRHYDAIIGSDISSLQIQPMANENDAFCQIVRADSTGDVAVSVGKSDVEIRVEAMDKSTTSYIISILRPSPADAHLKELSFSTGMMVPDFHRAEYRYNLLVDFDTSDLTFLAPSLDVKAKVVISSPRLVAHKVGLFLGDTLLEIRVTSSDATNTQLYSVTIRKEKPHVPVRPLMDELVDSNMLCSLCCNNTFRPRSYVRTASSCDHQFCFTCHDILRTTAQESEEAGVKSTTTACPLCPEALWGNNVILETDPIMEARLEKIMIACPYTKYGCMQASMDITKLADHLKGCQFSPGYCTECYRYGVALNNLEGGKHREACTNPCACGARVRTSDAGYHNASIGCPLLHPEKGEPKVEPAASWEKAIVNKRASLGSVESCTKAAEEKISSYLQSLEKAYQLAEQTMGQSTARPDASLLNEAASLYAAAISINSESHLSKATAWDENLHLRLGLVLEEITAITEVFPLPAMSRAENLEASENTAAAESFMSDEVDGLLEQLEIAKSSSDARKIRALEGEYHRLLENGNSDKAAEVQGLHSWFVRKVAGASGVAGWDSSKGPNLVLNAEIEKYMEKYRAALTINPVSFEAKLLLQCGRSSEALPLLRIAQACKPLSKPTRTLTGLCLLKRSSAESDLEERKEGLQYLEEFVEEQRLHVEQSKSLLATTPTILALAPDMHLALVRGYRFSKQLPKAAAVLFDLLDRVPDEIRRSAKRSVRANKLGSAICCSLAELLKILPLLPGDGPQKRLASIESSLLQLARRFASTLGTTEEAQARNATTAELAAQALVARRPRNARFLAALGTSQLEQFDVNANVKKLDEAEQSFLAAIEAESGYLPSDDPTVPLTGIAQQIWWVDWVHESEVLKKAALATSSTAKPGAKPGVKPTARKVAAPAAPSKQVGGTGSTAARPLAKPAKPMAATSSVSKPALIVPPKLPSKVAVKASPALAVPPKPSSKPGLKASAKPPAPC